MMLESVFVCVCTCVCVRARVRVRACVRVSMCQIFQYISCTETTSSDHYQPPSTLLSLTVCAGGNLTRSWAA